jgi:hypothetical protein
LNWRNRLARRVVVCFHRQVEEYHQPHEANLVGLHVQLRRASGSAGVFSGVALPPSIDLTRLATTASVAAESSNARRQSRCSRSGCGHMAAILDVHHVSFFGGYPCAGHSIDDWPEWFNEIIDKIEWVCSGSVMNAEGGKQAGCCAGSGESCAHQ